ncbi:MAG: hypothetical protein HZC51_10125 [Nitrospirae bacterium]|nr:hypothetical protein [Nitrospirota bacterium]
MDKSTVLRFFRNGILIFLVMFAMVWAKTYHAGNAQFNEGEKNLKINNVKDAITNYETAIHMYTPLSGYVPDSAQRLWEIGQDFEKSGDYDWALIAYRSLRSSFYAVRSFYTPYQEWIDRTEKQIDLVLAAKQQQEMAARPGNPQEPISGGQQSR